MSTFAEDLVQIQTSVYGKDMRAAIYDALIKLSERTIGRELTLQEYDALPTEEKYNGLLYFITDEGYIIKDGIKYGSGGGSPVGTASRVTNGPVSNIVGNVNWEEE